MDSSPSESSSHFLQQNSKLKQDVPHQAELQGGDRGPGQPADQHPAHCQLRLPGGLPRALYQFSAFFALKGALVIAMYV